MIKKRTADGVLTDAVGGIAVALAYATVEFILFSLVPLIRRPEAELNDPFWRATAMVLAAYAVIGGALGAVAGWLTSLVGSVQDDRSTRSLSVGTLALAVAFVGNAVARWPLSGGEAISVAVGLLLVGALVGSMRSQEWHERVRFLTGPLTATALLLLPPWIASDLLPVRSGLFRLGAIVAAFVGVSCLSLVFHRLRRTAQPETPYRYALGVVASLAVACAAGVALNPPPPKLPPRKTATAVQRPNVILIVMDTVRADHTSLYGYERDTTPNLRELAKEARVYRQAIAVSDTTLSTHASMFTGLYPRTHGAHYAPPRIPWGRPLAEHFTTLAEVLQTNGYRTMGVVANVAYLAPKMGLAQGFEVYDWRAPVHADDFGREYYLRRPVRAVLDSRFNTQGLDSVTRQAAEITDAAIDLVEQAEGPFFLFLNYMDAHLPYAPPAPFMESYPCADTRLTTYRTATLRAIEINGKERQITPDERTCIFSQYDAAVAYIDSSLKRLFQTTAKRGLDDHTMIIVTADHGEAFGEHESMGHGGISVYQEQTWVPLLIKFPDRQPGIIEEPVSQVDLMPTILDAAGITAPVPVHGESLRVNPPRRRRALFSASYPLTKWIHFNPALDRVETSVVLEDRKFISSTKGKRELYDLAHDRREETNLVTIDPSRSLSRRAELHDLSADPSKHDLYGTEVAVTARLETELIQWLASIPRFYQSGSDERADVDDNTRVRLRALGYVQ